MMKKFYLVSIIAVLLSAVSCVQENLHETVEGAVPYSFTADFGSAEAKATLEPGVTSSKVKWTEGDEVTVFAGENTHKYSAASTAYSSELNFVAVEEGEVPTQAVTYYAVHPYDADAYQMGGVITTTLPSDQIAEADNFSYHLAVAKATDNVLSFRNVCGLVRINIQRDDITSVVFQGLNGEIVAGGIDVIVSAEPTWESDYERGSQFIELRPKEPSNTIAPGVYYFAVLPQTFEKGFQIVAVRGDKTPIVKTAPDGIAVERGKMVGGTINSMQGTGIESDPYILTSIHDMRMMSELLNADATTYFKLGNDIDMSSAYGWCPVNYHPNCQIHFDGNGKTIRNFSCSGYTYASLFGVLTGTVKNLDIENATISGGSSSYFGIIGGILGYDAYPALLENVSVQGSVSGKSYLGGFAGQASGVTFKNCKSDVAITASGADVGGFIGVMVGSTLEFENCSAKVDISGTPSGNWRYGGLAGYLKTGTQCVVKGSETEVTINGISSTTKSASGMVAYVAVPTKIYQSRTSLDIDAPNMNNMGGFCGVLASSLEIKDCYSTGQISGSQAIAGLVGINESGTLTIANSYSSADISGLRGVAGLVGISKLSYSLAISKSVAWNPSVSSSRTSSANYSSAAVVGCASGTNTFTGCYRRSDMTFSDPFRTLTEHGDLNLEAMPLPDGVTDINQSAFDGKSTSEVSLSALSQTLGWSDTVWDFSSSLPVLRPYVADEGGSDDVELPDDEPVTIVSPKGWTTTIISSGMAHHALIGWDNITSAYQAVHVLEVDLNNPRYTIKFSVQPGSNGRSTTSACQVNSGAVAAVNATYERGSVFIKSEGEVASAIPNDEISDTGVPNWKSEAGIFLDANGKISIEYPGRTSLSLDYLRTYYGSHACPNIFSSAPMLIDDYDTVGEYFASSYKPEITSGLKSEHPYKHQSNRHPRTAAALTSDNHLLLMTIDGRNSGVAEGMSAKEVTLFLKHHFNPQYAINMDGGGSTAMSIEGQLMNNQNTNNNGNGERAVPTHFLVFDSKK